MLFISSWPSCVCPNGKRLLCIGKSCSFVVSSQFHVMSAGSRNLGNRVSSPWMGLNHTASSFSPPPALWERTAPSSLSPCRPIWRHSEGRDLCWNLFHTARPSQMAATPSAKHSRVGEEGRAASNVCCYFLMRLVHVRVHVFRPHLPVLIVPSALAKHALALDLFESESYCPSNPFYPHLIIYINEGMTFFFCSFLVWRTVWCHFQ